MFTSAGKILTYAWSLNSSINAAVRGDLAKP